MDVALSLLAMVAGLVVTGGLLAGRRLDGWTGVFLATTGLTNITGFLLPFTTFLASHAVAWRRAYVVGAVLLLYLNVFVLVAQLFRRLPALIASAPTQSELPFVITQLGTLVLFLWLGKAALKGFSAEPSRGTAAPAPATVSP